jgi:hypothetical protein
MNHQLQSLKITARLTGLLYFFFALIAIYSYMYVGGKIFVRGDPAATGNNMLEYEFLFRTSLFADMITNILFIIVIIFLYRLLKQVNVTQARLMAGIAAIAIPVSFVGEALQFTSMLIFKKELLTSFTSVQSQEIAALLLKLGNNMAQLVTFNWGLWLMPMGWLIYRSGFLPRFLAVLLWINGLGYMIASSTFILFPDYVAAVSKIVYPTYFIGELPLIFWLMIKGINMKKAGINKKPEE